MIGEVIEKNFQLYVEFEDGVIAVLPDFYSMNCASVWGDFDYKKGSKNDDYDDDYVVFFSHTPPFRERTRLAEFLCQDISNVTWTQRNAYVKKHEMSVTEIYQWKNSRGYPLDGTCNGVMRERILKIDKLKKRIKKSKKSWNIFGW